MEGAIRISFGNWLAIAQVRLWLFKFRNSAFSLFFLLFKSLLNPLIMSFVMFRFYKIMCVFYSALALLWVYYCIKYYRDILRIQYWIGIIVSWKQWNQIQFSGGVIVLGMVEKAFFLSEYATMNDTGSSIDGILEVAEIVSCAKKTMSRVLVIIVCVGYGVVKPRLGQTLNQVAGVGLVYFIFCSIEGIARVSKVSHRKK